MPEYRYDVVGLGNAIVDVISHADDAFLTQHQLPKGVMTLVDAERSQQLYAAMGPGIEASGGSAANTMAGVASFGGTVAFVGKVRDDQLGEVFAHDIRATGVDFDVPLSGDGEPTARCLILVTPDAQRTMNTFLGIAAYLTPDDVDGELIGSARITYCEGYLWDVEIAKEAIRKAMTMAGANGGQVALALSDGFCVDRHRSEFQQLVNERVDILFANEAEICSLYEVSTFDDAVAEVRRGGRLAFLTRGPKGSVVVRGDELHEVPAEPVEQVVDTTGAGDLYAAGALFGLTTGYDLATCGRLGSLAAAEVISHVGARPEIALTKLAEQLVGPRST